MRKPFLVLILGIVLFLAAVIGTAGFFYLEFAKSSGSQIASGPNAAGKAQDVVYEVKPNTSFMTIAQDLESAGVVRNAKFFNIFARLTGERSKVKVGEYLLNTAMLPAQVLSVITSGHSIARPFTIPEGRNIFEIADAFEAGGFGKKEDFLALCKDKNFIRSNLGEGIENCEGYLFPETYQVTKYTDLKTLMTAMFKRFETVYASVSVDSKPQFNLSKHQLVTLASIVEKETGAAQERPEIASVFYNRLNKAMRLQTDPTIMYGIMDQTGVWPENIHKEDILKPNRYNTYVIAGLPPGPITNPGKAALDAVMRPASTSYLFFVSQNNGTHIFTSDYKDHQNAVKKFQLDPKAREGHSWKELNQNKQGETK